MEQSEDIKAARDALQNLIKAKKTLRLYPHNNPIYIKTLEDLFNRFKNYFNYKDELSLRIGQNTISYDSEELYHNPQKEDNVALFFFKDGLRELTFKKGLLKEELEEFMRIITLDFDKEVVDDDVVTLLWEKDFRNIQYVVDESILLEGEAEEYENRAVNKLKQEVSDIEGLMKVYKDEIKEEDVKDAPVIPFADKDLQMLMRELEKDWDDKLEKLADILYEVFYQSEEMDSVLEDTLKFLKDTLRFSMKRGDIGNIIYITKKAREVQEDPLVSDEKKEYIKKFLKYPGSDEIISLLGELLNSGADIDEEVFKEFIALLDEESITPLVKVLGELKTFRVREKVIDALVHIGRRDIKTLALALSDYRWYVVRNIIYILRKIGDKGAIEYLLKIISHGDIRVRKEAVKALAELGGEEVLQSFAQRLDDPDEEVRILSVKAIGNIGSENAKRIILEKISDKKFRERDFEEKKEFYGILSRWKEKDIYDFLMRTLKKGSFFRRSTNYENRACAALTLGLLGNRDALPYLYKLKDSKDTLLREFSRTAIKRLEHDK
jgi:hypothetical protein